MATFVTYGPLSFEKCILKRLTCDPVYTDDKVNLRYHKYTISFSAHLHPTQNNWKIVNPNGGLEINGRNSASYSAQAVFWWMNQPRQYFRLDFDSHHFLEVPQRSDFKVDSQLGPRCYGVTVVEAVGATGYSDQGAAGAGGHFLVNATIEVGIDHLGDSIGFDNVLLQGWSMTCVHDLDAETWLTTRTTQIKMHIRPEALYSQANADNQFISRQMTPIANLCLVPDFYRRIHARAEVLTDMTSAMMMFVDRETGLDIGANSPSLSFSPTQHYAVSQGSGEKNGGGFQAGMRIAIEASYTPYDNMARQKVIEQCFWWIMAMGQGGGQGLPRTDRFRMYSEVIINIDFQACRIAVSCNILFQPGNPNQIVGDFIGKGGLPVNFEGMQLDASTQNFNIKNATRPAWDADEVAAGGALKNPQPPDGWHSPFFLSIIQKIMDWAGNPQTNRQQPDGWERFCTTQQPIPQNSLPQQEEAVFHGGPLTLQNVDAVDHFTINDFSTGQILDNQQYESTWMTTRYRTDAGDAVLPLGGTMPGGSTDPKPSAVRINLHQAVTEKAVIWGIQSIGPVAPKYPSKDTFDPKDVYVRADIKPSAPIPVALGMYAWTVTGIYYFNRTETKQAGDRLTTGHLPISIADAFAFASDRAEDGRLPGV